VRAPVSPAPTLLPSPVESRPMPPAQLPPGG
jgi:hypothetical protein